MFTKFSLKSGSCVSSINNKFTFFKTWGGGLKEYILGKAMEGEQFPGLKPVMTAGSRMWSLDNVATIKALKTAGFLKKDYETIGLISPTQAEKDLKELKPKDHKKRYEKLAKVAITLTEGNPTLAKESDKRESIAPVDHDMDAVEDDDIF